MNNLKKLRTKNVVTQDEVAKVLHTTKSNISIMEKGRLSVKNAELLANYFGVSIIEIFDEDIFKVFPKTDEEKLYIINMLKSKLNVKEEIYENKETY
nr:MAG TPA: helix-turn-helix domain protein [Caudoviricetes sp.]